MAQKKKKKKSVHAKKSKKDLKKTTPSNEQVEMNENLQFEHMSPLWQTFYKNFIKKINNN